MEKEIFSQLALRCIRANSTFIWYKWQAQFFVTNASKSVLDSTYLTLTAAVWSLTFVQEFSAPETWIDFILLLKREFVYDDHVRRSRNRLRTFTRTGSIFKYRAEFRTVVLWTGDTSKCETFDRFTQKLKDDIRVDVFKSGQFQFDGISEIALNIDSAIWVSKRKNQVCTVIIFQDKARNPCVWK